MKFAVINPPSPFLLNDRVFLSLGPLQIVTTAREADWRVDFIDLTGHASRCDGRASGNGMSLLDAAHHMVLAGAASVQTVVHGHDSDKCEAEIWDYARRRIRASHADVFGIYAMSCHAAYAVRLLQIIREEHPGARVIVGGPHASLMSEEFVAVGFDAVIAAQTGGGGGDEPFLALLKDVQLDMFEIGRVYRSSGKRNRSWFSWPDRSLVDWRSYEYRLRGERAASIVTQYGCPYHCTFCSHGPGYVDLRHRDIDHVRAELRELRSRFGLRAVMLYDDEVNIDGRKSDGHFARLCRALRDEGFIWRAFIKSNIFDENQARLAAECGAVQFCTGAESADPAIKRRIKKGSTVDDDERFVDLCMKYGIAVKVFSMVGLPGETAETADLLRMFHLRQVAKDSRLYDFDVTVYTPYPGTVLFDDPEKHGLRVVRSIEYTRDTVVYKGRPGEYVSYTETFDPITGRTLMTADEIVAWRDKIESDVRIAAGETRLRRDVG